MKIEIEPSCSGLQMLLPLFHDFKYFTQFALRLFGYLRAPPNIDQILNLPERVSFESNPYSFDNIIFSGFNEEGEGLGRPGR